MRAPWLGEVLRGAGLTVVEHNPIGRGRDMRTVNGVVVHDTVTTRSWDDEDVCALLRDGRPGVPGPLSQLGLDRQGRFHFIADGRANHNGYGTWGNDAIGIETFAAGGMKGREERWNSVQEEAAAVGSAAILDRLGLSRSRVRGHKETDPERKVDPWRVDMGAFRRRVAQGGQHTSEEEDVIKKGEKGAHVKRAQWRINQALHGHHDPEGGGLTVTGVFDDATERYVKHLQHKAGYATSGVLDLATYMYICEVAHVRTSHR